MPSPEPSPTNVTRVNFGSRKRNAPGGYLEEVGHSGLLHYSGYIAEEFLSELTGWRWRRIVKEMTTNDGVVWAMFFLIDLMARGVTWNMVAAGDDNESKRDAEFVESCMNDMSTSWRDTIADVLSFLPWGFSWHEVCYKIRDGKRPVEIDADGKIKPRDLDATEDPASSKYDDGMIGWRKIPIRAQDSLDRWDIDKGGGIHAMHQLTINGPARIPIEKSVLFRTSAHKNNPEGRSLCRRIYRPWFFKQKIENLEGIGIERDLAGVPVGYMPVDYMKSDASDEYKAIYEDFKRIITEIKRDEQEGIIVPSDIWPDSKERMFEIKLMSSGGQRSFDTSKIIQRYDQRILMTLMADFLLLGHEKVGSFALASSKTEMFSLALGSFLDIIKDIFNRHAIPRLLELNGRPTENPPLLDHGDVETVDLKDVADYISKISGTKVYLDDDQQRWLLEQAGMPVVEGKPMPQPPAPVVPVPGTDPKTGKPSDESGGQPSADPNEET